MLSKETDIIDVNILQRFGGNVSIFCRVQGRFLEEAQAIEAKLIKAHAEGSATQVWEELHALKGMSATMGAKALAELTASFEKTVKSSEEADSLSSDDLQELSDLILESHQALTELAASLS